MLAQSLTRQKSDTSKPAILAFRSAKNSSSLQILKCGLICENLHMCTLVEGDASYHTWRRLGNLISACVAKGLHGEIEVSADVPFWMSEVAETIICSHIYLRQDYFEFS